MPFQAQSPSRILFTALLILATLVASSVSFVFATPVGAAPVVNDPPPPGHQIISFPSRDFVSSSGFNISDGPFTVTVIRNGIVIGTSEPIVAHDDAKAGLRGVVDVNHPGGGCWAGVTPDILPGDQIRVTNAAGTVADQTTTANVTADFPVQTASDTIQVHGTAQAIDLVTGAPLAQQLPVAQVESRLVVNKLAFEFNGRRTIRAGGAGKDGTLAYDVPGSTTNFNWTATYSGLSSADVALALDSDADQSRAIWLGRNPLGLTELTIYEFNQASPGPAAPCTAPLARNAVTGSNPAAFNLASVGADLIVSGVAQDAASVAVTLTGSATLTAPATTPTPATGSQTWSVSFPAAQVAALSDGTLTAAATYTLTAAAGGGTLTGASLAIVKDTVAPTVSANVPAGLYKAPQSILLSSNEGGQIYYTTDGSTPTTASTRFVAGTPIVIGTNGTTTLKALTIDAAGNPSAVLSQAYTIDTIAPAVGASPPGGTYGTPQSVALSANEPGAVIRYTLDGSVPTASSAVYTGPIAIGRGVTNLKYFATDPAGNQSAVALDLYRIDAAVPAPGPGPAPIPAFCDVAPGAPYYTAVTQLAARGVIRGYPSGCFGPDDHTLRAQMAALIVRAMGWGGQAAANPFPDRGPVDAELWQSVAILNAHGVARGFPDGTYRPAEDVLAVQTISFITRAMVDKGYWTPQPDDPTLARDVPGASGHRQDVATYLHYVGRLPGVADATTWANWDQPSTRAWFAQALWAALESHFGVGLVP